MEQEDKVPAHYTPFNKAMAINGINHPLAPLTGSEESYTYTAETRSASTKENMMY